jgi:hypothetical protein
MAAQQRAQMSISAARPPAWSRRIDCIASEFQMAGSDDAPMLPTGSPSSM